ncbi:hypothetical protein A1O1_08571 [Capronia coronata CBS 617.96]|uniref:ABM domain-containing protein n=1 Tax=Capronia coronata CBS 617.96 TaxID=1182541 RepID=W9XTX3_9EURO|nr:uncharacterized protein A1O1_08571 [Capronia coronata CBS 617.96]EXJ80426.1 hypothetical protein A1O1_08571 [Capronia coronata CBS 617.96]
MRCFFTPATRKGAPLGKVPPGEAEQTSLIAGIEIFTRPSALTAIQASPEYKEYFSPVGQGEALFTRDVTAWYPTAGFVARKDKDQPETGPAKVVMLARFVCKDGEGMREKLVAVLGTFCDWVESHEPTTLTYSVMIQPTKNNAPNEVLLFERYKDLAALSTHSKTAEFRAML